MVPVNKATAPTGSGAIKTTLDKLFAPALVTWNVTIASAITVADITEEGFKTTGLSMASRYTSDMNKVIKAYKETHKISQNTLVLFFVTSPNSDKMGYMPLTGDYGFIFNLSSNVELLAHELSHGAFNLRHTFSDDAYWRGNGKAPVFPEKTTQNLMDYANGTELWKYQWDLIHDPEGILFGALDEEEGALKGISNVDEITNVIEMIRCAYKTNRSVKFTKDVWGWATETTKVENFKGLYDNQTYPYIAVVLLDDKNPVELPQTITFKKESDEIATFDFKTIKIKVSLSHAQALARYLQPSDFEYGNQKVAFINRFKEYTRDRVLKILRTTSQCLFESLTGEQRISLLTIINDGSNISEEAERIVIDIIRTTPKNQIAYLFDQLYSTGLMAYYDRVINDVGGEDNHERFIVEMLKLYFEINSDKLRNCYTTTEWGEIIIRTKVEQANLGQLSSLVTQSSTPLIRWANANYVPDWKYFNNKMRIPSSVNFKGSIDVNPFDPVVVFFVVDLPFFKLPESFHDRVVALPAFALSWFYNEASDFKIANTLETAVVLAENIETLFAAKLVAPLAKKWLISAYNYWNKADAVLNILLKNDKFKEAVEKIGDNQEGKQFLDTYKNLSPWLDYLGKPGVPTASADLQSVLL